ncbi:CDP-diacylglycerol--glycerol-3-phosphate 3-phosphatidyltransferase [Metallococcus carri]|uniref:CDP-diacylglycerol--glycerol-3-phosphate 3-phosphatidyltransferase n=1 Tax=Metallococcus carri TaxID=1656884 RepID=UPI0038B2F01B
MTERRPLRNPDGSPRLPELVPDPATVPSQNVSNWNIANALTMVRIALVPVFGWLLLARGGQDHGLRIGAFAVFTLASLTDRIDGELARSRGLVTDFGKMMDPIADKALMGMALIGLCLIDRLPWWVTIVILVREIGITLLRLSILRHGVLPASRGGKVKTFLQAVAVGLFVLPLVGWPNVVAWVILLLAVVVTVLTGVDYVFRALRLRRGERV